MANQASEISLSLDDLREVAGFAAACAEDVLDLFERAHPEDSRPREAIDAAWAFARGGKRGKALRDTAWAALRAAGEPEDAAAGHPSGASEAARAAMASASAAYLHPLANADQVKHILGAAAHGARAVELAAGDDRAVGAAHLELVRGRASSTVIDVLCRYPSAPWGGRRVGELTRDLGESLRNRR